MNNIFSKDKSFLKTFLSVMFLFVLSFSFFYFIKNVKADQAIDCDQIVTYYEYNINTNLFDPVQTTFRALNPLLCPPDGGGGGEIGPQVSISVDNSTIYKGESTTVSWSSVAASSCYGVGSGKSGSVPKNPIVTTEYIETCIGYPRYDGTNWKPAESSVKVIVLEAKPVGSCGSSDGGTFSTKPTSGLCSVGTASTVSGSGPWSWNCTAVGGTDSCSAEITPPLPPLPSCGSSDGDSFLIAPSSDLCSLGSNASAVTDSGRTWDWSCSRNGNSLNCAADKISVPLPVCGDMHNNCFSGNYISGSASQNDYVYSWRCESPSGTVSCLEPKGIIPPPSYPGECSTILNSCDAGYFVDTVDTSTTYNWNCAGVNGGATVSCLKSKTIEMVSASISASPAGFGPAGGYTTITWSSQNATSCSGTNFKTGGAVDSSSGVEKKVIATTTFSVSCIGSNGESASDSVTVYVEGNIEVGEVSCGTSNGSTFSTKPTSGLCSVGTASTVSGSGPWSWDCSTEGNSVSCSANKTIVEVEDPGSCGSSDGSTFSTKPTTGLCSVGTASTVSGSGPWSWNCSTTGGSDSCSANKTVVVVEEPGSCGSSDGGTFSTKPTSGLCSVGTASTVSGSGPWSWNCSTTGGSDSCSADKVITGSPVCGNTKYTCTRGSVGDKSESSTTWDWSCSTSQGGTSCSVNKTVTPSLGDCLTTHYGCAEGDSVDQVQDGNYYTWGCYTDNGTVSCSEDVEETRPLGSISATDCTIADGQSTCVSNVSWSISRPVRFATTEVTRNNPDNTSVSTSRSGSINNTVNHGNSSFFLYHDSSELASASVTASCIPVTSSWNGSSCQKVLYSPTVTLSANPLSIVRGNSTTLTWSSSNATICEGTNFNTGNTTSGSVTVSPVATTTYSIVCTGAGGQTPDSKTVTVTVGVKKPGYQEN